MARSVKGGKFERWLATRLSEWWLNGRSDIFWRVPTSGARATSRALKGLKTFGHAGDIAAIDPIGAPLMKVFAIEAKRGYTKYSPFDVLDKGAKAAKQTFEHWLIQVQASMQQAESMSWMLVFRRNQRLAVACFPYSFLQSLNPQERHLLNSYSRVKIVFDMDESDQLVTCMLLEDFLQAITPKTIKRLARTCSNQSS